MEKCNEAHLINYRALVYPPEGSWKPEYKMRNWSESRNNKGAVMVVLVMLSIATDLT
jgi:hypothetical protein